MYFTILCILTIIGFIAAIILIVRKVVITPILFVIGVIKDQLYLMEVEKRCNLNTERRLAQVLMELEKKNALIQEQEECIRKCGTSISSLQEEVAVKENEAANATYELAFMLDDGLPVSIELVTRCNRARAALTK